MPNPNAVVSSVLRVERDSIELGNERRVRLDPERPDTRGLGPILEGLSKLRQPVYIDFLSSNCNYRISMIISIL
jgi:hypothetical protein